MTRFTLLEVWAGNVRDGTRDRCPCAGPGVDITPENTKIDTKSLKEQLSTIPTVSGTKLIEPDTV